MSPVLVHRLVAALALPLALTACGGNPITPPPLTPATSTTSTPTPTEQPETAEEFIRRWVEVDTAMQNSGDAAEYLAMTRGCEACSLYASDIEKIYERGGSVRTAGWEILRMQPPTGPANTPSVVFLVRSHPTHYVPRQGAAEELLPGGQTKHRVELERAGTSWKVTYLAEVAQ